MKEDFFSHERLKRNRSYLTEKANELATLSKAMNIREWFSSIKER